MKHLIIGFFTVAFLGGCTEWKINKCVKEVKKVKAESLMECMESDEADSYKMGCVIGNNMFNENTIRSMCESKLRDY